MGKRVMNHVVGLGFLMCWAVCGASSDSGNGLSALTLDRALELALSHHPTLAAYAWDLRAADARRLQAGLRPNPELSFDIEDVRWEEGAGSKTVTRSMGTDGAVGWERSRADGPAKGLKESEFTLVVAQLIEFGRKRALRVELANQDRALVEWDYQAAKANVLTEVRKAFVGVLAAQEQRARAAEAEKLARRMSGVVQERVAAGDASPIDAMSAELSVVEAAMALSQADRALDAARRRLATLCGVEPSSLGQAQGDLSVTSPVPAFEDLAARVEANPDLARWAAELARRRVALQVETSKRVPDVRVSAGVRVLGVPDGRERGYGVEGPTPRASRFRSETKGDADYDTMLVAGFSLPIPVFDRNQGGIREAEHLAAKASEERRAVAMEVTSALAEAHAAMAAAFDAVTTLRETALPKAEEAYKLTQEGYQAGKFDLVRSLAAETALLTLRTRYITSMADYHLAAADVERLIGGPIAN